MLAFMLAAYRDRWRICVFRQDSSLICDRERAALQMVIHLRFGAADLFLNCRFGGFESQCDKARMSPPPLPSKTCEVYRFLGRHASNLLGLIQHNSRKWSKLFNFALPGGAWNPEFGFVGLPCLGAKIATLYHLFPFWGYSAKII